MRVRTGAVLLALVGMLVATTAVPAVAERGPNRGHEKLTVMTRNVYLGGNINRPVDAALAAQAADGSELEVLVALANATDQTRDIVDATDFGVRAGLLADEIAATEPDLIGLQEVAWWRSGPLQLDQVGVPNATTTDYDFLAMLLAELSARGEDYTAVAVGERADVEAPSFSGSPADGSWEGQRDVRLTMRDVILMRDQGDREVTGSGDTIFDANLAVPVAGVRMRFDRGFQWVDVTSGREQVRFVNSHFEAFSSDLALAQAQQVVAEATAPDRPTIFVCDCNSDPLDDRVKPIDTVPHRAAYDFITGAGYRDLWLSKYDAADGWTSGLSERVRDDSAAGFDHRIDMIFSHVPDGRPVKADQGVIVGDELADRDSATGLWPSDHAGVVLRLRTW